jgi:hypothetical protein
MVALICFVLAVLGSPFKSKSPLQAENAVLRHQLIVLQRKVRGRAHLTNNDRWFFVQMYRWFPSILKVVTIIEPETLVRWHRAGFRRYWRWKSRSRGGRPQINVELRALIRRMSREKLFWGAPRIHGELLELGFSVAQSTVATYMVKRRGSPSQGWRTFLRNHAPDIAAMNLFVVPTIWLQTGLRLRDCAASSQRSRMDQRHNQPDSGVGCTPDHRGISLGWGSALYDPRPRSTAPLSHADFAPWASEIANCASLTLAEWLCRTVDRIDPARVLGPCRCFGRGTSAPDSKIIRRLLQLRQNASVIAQGCADFSSDSSDRIHSFTPDPRRASPSLRPSLSFRYTHVFALR